MPSAAAAGGASQSMTPAQMEAAQARAIVAQIQSGPAPWSSIVWNLGGRPETDIDIPITAVFLALFIGGAVSHAALFFRNKKRGHFFPFNMLMFGLCMARTVTCCLRIAWAANVENVKLGIAAQIFVAAGVIIVYIANLFFTQRIVRARHPRIGWHRGVTIAFTVFFGLVFVCLAMVITATVQNFYTLSLNTKRIDRDIQLAVASYFLFVAILPVPVIIAALAAPRADPLDKFGRGRHRHQLGVVLVGSLVISLGAAYRLGTSALPPVPIYEPLPAYFHRACFYVFNFVLEIVVIYFYLFARIDQRFHVPNGARGPGSYSQAALAAGPDGELPAAPEKPHKPGDDPAGSGSRVDGDRV